MSIVEDLIHGKFCNMCGDKVGISHTCGGHKELDIHDLDVAINTLQDTLKNNSEVWDKLFFSPQTREQTAKRIRNWIERQLRINSWRSTNNDDK